MKLAIVATLLATASAFSVNKEVAKVRTKKNEKDFFRIAVFRDIGPVGDTLRPRVHVP